MAKERTGAPRVLTRATSAPDTDHRHTSTPPAGCEWKAAAISPVTCETHTAVTWPAPTCVCDNLLSAMGMHVLVSETCTGMYVLGETSTGNAYLEKQLH